MHATKEINFLKTTFVLSQVSDVPVEKIIFGIISSADWIALTNAAAILAEDPDLYVKTVNDYFGRQVSDYPDKSTMNKRFKYFFNLMRERVDLKPA